MRICVYGAGAIGGHFAVRLARAGNAVSLVARGEHLEAIRRDGLILQEGDSETAMRLPASSRAADLGEQDVVLVTLKTTAMDGLASALAPMLGRDTTVVFAQNGIPWWYNIGAPPSPTTPDLSWMDPGGQLAELAPRVIGAVIYNASEVVRPGVVRNNSPEIVRLNIGEPHDGPSDRVTHLRQVLHEASITSPEDSLRRWVWAKLVVNMSVSLPSLVTGTGAGELREKDPAFEAIYMRLYHEGNAIAAAHYPAYKPSAPVKPRASHKPSILQDYELGRPMEIDPLVTAPLAFARAAGLATPTLDLIGALAVQKAEAAGLHRPVRPLPIA